MEKNMVEDYRIILQCGRAEPTGKYEITRRGTRKAVLQYAVTYKTPIGDFKPEEWRKRALDAIAEAGEMNLLGKIKEYCRNRCAWLRKNTDLEEYAIDCLCGRIYTYWEDFCQ